MANGPLIPDACKSSCGTGPGPLSYLCCDGHEYLAKASTLKFSVDEASTQYETNRTIRVIESTPLRARLRFEGAHFRANDERHLSYRLDVEVWAGWPTVRLDYQCFNLEPGVDYRPVSRIAMEANWHLGEKTQRYFVQEDYGLAGMSRHVLNPDPVALVTDFLGGYAHVETPNAP